jgi:hypothetical protein
VQEVQVNVQNSGRISFLSDKVLFPDLIEEGSRACVRNPARQYALQYQ